jgi:hypothetical protein
MVAWERQFSMSLPKNPLARLNRQELLWLAGILKDACRERLEKNLVSQALENRLYERGPVEGRVDPRPFLRIWEPRYRKFLEVAGDLHALLESEQAQALVQSLRAQTALPRRHAMIEENGARPRRKSRP